MLFLGCDSGATKAEFILVWEDATVLAHRVFPGVVLIADGSDVYRTRMQAYVRALLQEAGTSGIACAAFGLTEYGETRSAADDMREVFSDVLSGIPCRLMNDSVTGWCGAMRGKPGICIAAGTGSVAYGEDEQGNGARAGGWSIRFADEGSAYWVAVQAIRTFFHQADGRMEKTLLYDHFMRLLGVKEPLHACGAIEEYTGGGNHARVAGIQKEVLSLYQKGDPCAKQIYRDAAKSLSLLVRSIDRRLTLGQNQRAVSYTGGLFRAGDCILEPLRQYVEQMGFVLVPPRYGPLAGAVGYAARGFVEYDRLEHLMAQADRHEANT